MKTVKIPGIVVLMVPFIIYIIYWFIMQSIDAQGSISRTEIERRLNGILFLEKQFDINKLLASPQAQDYV